MKEHTYHTFYRDDFKMTADGDVSFFDDILDALNIPRSQHSKIKNIELRIEALNIHDEDDNEIYKEIKSPSDES